MYLGYFTEEAYDRLLNDIDQNLEKYKSEEDWIKQYFGNEDYYKVSKSVNVMSFNPYYVPGSKSDEQKSQEDLNNVRMLYEAYKSLTPLQASNKYMWTYLCHANPECRKYIIDRWLSDARENTIRTRFFVKTSRDLLNDNALSRLWWYGYLTYDESNSNPYALTEILLTNQTICTDVIDTLNRMNFQRIKGLLLAIKDFKEIVEEKEGITDYVRSCNKYINRYAAVTTMELLDAEEIRKLAYDYMAKQRDAKKRK